MSALYLNSDNTDSERRVNLYHGNLMAYSPSEATKSLCDFADELIRDAFKNFDPELAQWQLPVNLYVDILKDLKPKFINHMRSKELIRQILKDSGCDLDKTYFDVPRLRTSTSDGYLTSGLAYAFHPHRDTWYSAPGCQINWWIPVYDITPENGMLFITKYWNHPIKNDSDKFSYREWKEEGRKICATQVENDNRWQPGPQEPVDMSSELRVIPEAGGMVMFSGAHLHASVPNTSGKTRFSIDFRTINIDDVIKGIGAPNIDSASKDLTLADFIRASDFAHFSEQLVYTPVENEKLNLTD